MPSPLKGFFWVMSLVTLFGVLVGTLNLLNPSAVHIPFGIDENGVRQSAEGLDGLLAATLSSMVLGFVFGCVAAIMAWGFRAAVGKTKR